MFYLLRTESFGSLKWKLKIFIYDYPIIFPKTCETITIPRTVQAQVQAGWDWMTRGCDCPHSSSSSSYLPSQLPCH